MFAALNFCINYNLYMGSLYNALSFMHVANYCRLLHCAMCSDMPAMFDDIFDNYVSI